MHGFDLTTPGSAIRRTMKLDAETGDLVVASLQPNINDCLTYASILRKENEAHSTSLWQGRDYVKVASVPLWLVEKWMKEEGISPWSPDPDIRAKYHAKLNDPDYAYCRTAPGSI